eukprot:SAG11_NODE_15892_length_563_cov_1.280172_1_plen_91_part_00
MRQVRNVYVFKAVCSVSLGTEVLLYVWLVCDLSVQHHALNVNPTRTSTGGTYRGIVASRRVLNLVLDLVGIPILWNMHENYENLGICFFL